MQHHISIIIPVLNEKTHIGKLLEYLQEVSSKKNIAEIIVVDGGSTDGSIHIISKFKNITLIHSDQGRAKQMNVGAKKATGSILYFLHADSFPPKQFDALIINETQQGNEAGCFRMQFDSDHWWLKLAGWFTKFNWKACRGGDQSLFITKTLFDTIGGYDERYTIYEDNILINELYARKQFVVINKKLKSSARMYRKHGVWKLQYYYWSIYIKRWLGADADTLYYYYKKKVC
ncbi:TIGR04283 family arsenosugar biosynthesis glycosyltransferase [Aestuariivivens insulae]|uniref:TIGR04283 family arsenosugar biosynthesis glycosyltransferase n=1 Tax=Aestuariivivens insulae TaxID=1621988 RepID=UPI001F597EF5|nr:TIGR04283 family arsenosugar biosynthesis glycosyltransferase [Aestuariivivens insulae]